MRRRFVQINGELHEVVDGIIEPRLQVMPEISPYKSMITGEMITSRAQHREHLKRHGMREIGNEIKYITQQPLPDANPAGRKELIRSQVDAMSEKQFRQAIKRDIDFARWNSRRD